MQHTIDSTIASDRLIDWKAGRDMSCLANQVRRADRVAVVCGLELSHPTRATLQAIDNHPVLPAIQALRGSTRRALILEMAQALPRCLAVDRISRPLTTKTILRELIASQPAVSGSQQRVIGRASDQTDPVRNCHRQDRKILVRDHRAARAACRLRRPGRLSRKSTLPSCDGLVS